VADVSKRQEIELGRFVPRLQFTALALKQDRHFQHSDQQFATFAHKKASDG
jgi:hypothetical protein